MGVEGRLLCNNARSSLFTFHTAVKCAEARPAWVTGFNVSLIDEQHLPHPPSLSLNPLNLLFLLISEPKITPTIPTE